MATRTIKLIGKAYSTSGDVSLAVNFNNTEVFNGTVTTTTGVAPQKGESGIELATWTVDTSVTGGVPMTIAVSGGVLQFNDLQGNYSGFELNEDKTVAVAPDAYFGMLNYNTEASDGKDNVSFSEVDGDGQQRIVEEASEAEGDWVYSINDGVTFSCDFVLDPDLVITSVPTP